jgi:hypothetical protein
LPIKLIDLNLAEFFVKVCVNPYKRWRFVHFGDYFRHGASPTIAGDRGRIHVIAENTEKNLPNP